MGFKTHELQFRPLEELQTDLDKLRAELEQVRTMRKYPGGPRAQRQKLNCLRKSINNLAHTSQERTKKLEKAAKARGETMDVDMQLAHQKTRRLRKKHELKEKKELLRKGLPKGPALFLSKQRHNDLYFVAKHKKALAANAGKLLKYKRVAKKQKKDVDMDVEGEQKAPDALNPEAARMCKIKMRGRITRKIKGPNAKKALKMKAKKLSKKMEKADVQMS